MSIEKHVHNLPIVESLNRSVSCADYKGWISGPVQFPLELHSQVFPMAEVVNDPFSLRQDEPASMQYEDPEKSSVTNEKVYDGG